MSPRRKTFRSIVCSILAVLVFIHTTPLHAQEGGSGGSFDPASNLAPGNSSAPTMASSSGAATYSVPIEVPKGRGGISPNLSITYNSYQGNGLLGVGFGGLDMGAIQRATKTPGGLVYNSDRFQATVNGSVADLIQRDDWGTDHFESKIEGAFLNYYFNRASGGWEVRDKSGTVYYYGCNPETRHSRQDTSQGTFKWFLDRVQDVNGNFMTVTYSQDRGHVYLSRIDYTGNVNGLPTTNYVTFGLITRDDVITSYASYAADTTAYRLGTISVYANVTAENPNGEFARAYVLTYAYSPGSYRSTLQSVSQRGTDWSALPPVSFDWQLQPETPGFENEVRFGNTTANISGGQMVDLNGDSLPDFIYDPNVNGATGQFRVYHNTGSGLDPNFDYFPRTQHYLAAFKNFYVNDVNGDGLPDIIYIDDTYHVRVLLNTGTGFQADTSYGVLPPGTFQVPKMVDVNGDGLVDLVWSGDGLLTPSTVNVLLSAVNPDGSFYFKPAAQWGSRAEHFYYREQEGDADYYLMADVNGDGLPDLVYAAGSGSSFRFRVLLNAGAGFQADTVWLPTQSVSMLDRNVPFIVADFTGDGLADLSFKRLNKYRVAISSGTGFNTDTDWGTQLADFAGQTGAFAADVNGDGLPDVVYYAVSQELRVLINTGHSLLTDTPWATVTGAGATWPQQLTTDINADGVADWVIYGNLDGGYGVDSFVSKGHPDLVTGIRNGIRGSYTIRYKPSSAWPADPNDPKPRLPFILQTISSITADDGSASGNSSTTGYEYAGGYFDWPTLEFRGFSTVMTTLPNGNLVESRFHTDGVFKGLMHDQWTRDADRHLYLHLHNTYDDLSPADRVHFP